MEQRLPSFGGKGSTGAYVRYKVEDRSYFSIIKKDIAQAAKALGFPAEKIGKLQIVVAELASNLLKFGVRNREFLWKPIHLQGKTAIEMITLDKGPGVGSVSQAMEDGFSTSGTAGEGLGAIQRLSHFFELYSRPGQGTIALSRFFLNDSSSGTVKPFTFAALSVAKPNETVCGDGYFIEYVPENKILNILVLDGLGHGPGAHEASSAAIEKYALLTKESPKQVLKEIHQHIKHTRGAVSMTLKYKFEEQMLSYCSIGNIAGKTIGFNNVKNFSSFNGIVGHVMPGHLQDQEVAWERGNLLIIHSDGLRSRWNITEYAHAQKYDPVILAACLYRDHNRGNDDTTIIVSKHPDIDGTASKPNS